MKKNHDLDVASLRTFQVVAELKTFTAAARELGRTQSGVSQQIQKLEHDVGAPLLVRKPRMLELTENGEVLLGYARQILRLHDDARVRIDPRGTGSRVRLGVNYDFASAYLSRLLTELVDCFPELRFEVEVGLSRDLVRRVYWGEMDLVLAKSRPDTPRGHVVFEDRLVWVAGAGSRFDQELTSNPQTPLPLVLFPEECAYRAVVLRALGESGQPWRVEFSSPSLNAIQAAVVAGVGVSALIPGALRDGIVELNAPLPRLPQIEVALHVSPLLESEPAHEVAKHIRKHSCRSFGLSAACA